MLEVVYQILQEIITWILASMRRPWGILIWFLLVLLVFAYVSGHLS